VGRVADTFEFLLVSAALFSAPLFLCCSAFALGWYESGLGSAKRNAEKQRNKGAEKMKRAECAERGNERRLIRAGISLPPAYDADKNVRTTNTAQFPDGLEL
jgi:hypothetical protein